MESTAAMFTYSRPRTALNMCAQGLTTKKGKHAVAHPKRPKFEWASRRSDIKESATLAVDDRQPLAQLRIAS